MPELPEVETIVRSLRHPLEGGLANSKNMNDRPGVVGRLISSAQILWSKTLAEPSSEEFLANVVQQTIQSAERRGKFIVLPLEKQTLLIHLRMSGDIRVENDQPPIQPHDRAILNFEDGYRLAFNDTRKFGRIWLVNDTRTVLGGLGPEPFDENFHGQDLFERLHRSSRNIKTLLLDQTLIAGIGNIYADEALFRARLHPALPGKEISAGQAEFLLASIRGVLTEGIARNGSSIDWVYRGGDFQNHFRVYQRTGLPCLECGTVIEKRVINQRSTHFCPKCQFSVKIP